MWNFGKIKNWVIAIGKGKEKLKLKSFIYVKTASNIPEQSCINQATKVEGDAAAADRRCTSQATKVAGSAAVADARSTSQATRVAGSAALAAEKSIDQATKLASEHALISIEVLELIEAVPRHEFFIQEH